MYRTMLAVYKGKSKQEKQLTIDTHKKPSITKHKRIAATLELCSKFKMQFVEFDAIQSILADPKLWNIENCVFGCINVLLILDI